MTSREGWAAAKIAAEMCGLPAGTRPRSVRYSPLITHKGWLVGFGGRVFVQRVNMGGGRHLDEIYVSDTEVERALAVDNPFAYVGETAAEHIEALRKAFGL